MPSTDSYLAARDHLVVDRHALRDGRSGRPATSPSHALTSHSSGGSSVRMPACASASSARSASCGLDHRGRGRGASPGRRAPSWPGCRRAGTGRSASRSAAADLLSASSMSANGCSSSVAMAAWLPGADAAGMRERDELDDRHRRAAGRAAATSAAIRIAAAGDIHSASAPTTASAAAAAFARCAGRVDLVLLAGDLTTHGEPEQAAIVADAVPRRSTSRCSPCSATTTGTPTARDEVAAVLEEAGIDRARRATAPRARVCGDRGRRRRAPRASSAASPARTCRTSASRCCARSTPRAWTRPRRSTRACARSRMCPFRIVLLHYAPTTETLEGERREIWTFLGTDRLAAPIAEHEPGPRPARPRARRHVRGPRSARCRSTTSPCRCWARTSGSSRWRARARTLRGPLRSVHGRCPDRLHA